MSPPEQYRLRWRSQVSGPFPMTRIEQMLDEHEIGLWHEVELDGRWITLEEFITVHRERERQAEALRQQDAEAERVKLLVREIPPPVAAPPPPPGQALAPPDFPSMPARSNTPRRPLYRPKSLKIFVALGLLLGFGGAHNFYAGYRGTALVQLVLTCVTLWLGFGFIVGWVWALIELVIVQTDRKGVRMV